MFYHLKIFSSNEIRYQHKLFLVYYFQPFSKNITFIYNQPHFQELKSLSTFSFFLSIFFLKICMQDFMDGYFPSELQNTFPDGVPFKVCIKVVYLMI